MTFINWSDSEEMVGLLFEYVADERSESHADPARERFLSELSAELAAFADQFMEMSADEAIDRLRAIHRFQADDFVGDPVLAHVEACIDEMERIKRQVAGV